MTSISDPTMFFFFRDMPAHYFYIIADTKEKNIFILYIRFISRIKDDVRS